jgi:hypothetical protein
VENDQGEPLSVGRKTRSVPRAMLQHAKRTARVSAETR